MPDEALWQCPNCGRYFANRNQSHSCGQHTVEEHLQSKPPHIVAMYRRFEAAVQSCGPILIVPAKTRIGFQVRMIFASINKLGDSWIDAHVVLARRLENPRFKKIESLSPRNHVHHFRLYKLEEMDEEFVGWLREAYSVGKQEHLAK